MSSAAIMCAFGRGRSIRLSCEASSTRSGCRGPRSTSNVLAAAGGGLSVAFRERHSIASPVSASSFQVVISVLFSFLACLRRRPTQSDSRGLRTRSLTDEFDFDTTGRVVYSCGASRAASSLKSRNQPSAAQMPKYFPHAAIVLNFHCPNASHRSDKDTN
jgi:hypothetical protein